MFINIKNLVFSYLLKAKLVLDDISLSIEKGETLAFVGASGSGKSTFLRILAGLIGKKKDNFLGGDIVIDTLTPLEYLKSRKLSFMFQEPALLPNCSVRKNVDLPLRIRGIQDGEAKKEFNKKVQEIIEIVGLSGYEDYLPKDLSGGMKTRTSLARSFVTNPELLLLDEPFSSLDCAWRDALYSELKQLRDENGTTIILVTHDIDEALSLSDKIVCLSHTGKILLTEKNNHHGNLAKLIQQIIIEDHQLRKFNEKKNPLSVH